MPELPVLSVIVPVYNEVLTLAAVVERLHDVPLPMEIICVNDCSTDGSGALMDRLKAEGRIEVAVHQPVNRGKGAALRSGIVHA
ncbi:MAG: glycosyltransferase, partial [Gemmatimonadales bacterium]